MVVFYPHYVYTAVPQDIRWISYSQSAKRLTSLKASNFPNTAS